MTRPMHPADALELSLAGIVTAEGADGLLSAVASLRAASGAIAAPRGLRARRGALLAGAAPRIASRQPASLGRRLQAMLMAGTLAVVGSISFVGASVGISWLRDVLPDASAQGSPGVADDRTETPSPSPSPTLAPTPDPVPAGAPESADVDALEPARRMPVGVDDEESRDDDAEEEDETGVEDGADADDAGDQSED